MEVGVASEDDATAPGDVPAAAAEVEGVVDDDKGVDAGWDGADNAEECDDDPEREDEDRGAAEVRADDEESGIESVAMVECGGCRVPVVVLIVVSLFAIGEPDPGCSDSARDMYWSWRAGKRRQEKGG